MRSRVGACPTESRQSPRQRTRNDPTCQRHLYGIGVPVNGPGGTADYGEREKLFMEPVVLFGIQFTLSLAAYALIGFWYVVPRLSGLPREIALAPLLWIHAFRVVSGTILAPGAVDAGVPMEFRVMIGYGDLATAFLALLALILYVAASPVRSRWSGFP